MEINIQNCKNNSTILNTKNWIEYTREVEEALKKQDKFLVFDISNNNGAWKDGYCKCGHYVTDSCNYCHECGQKLVWTLKNKRG